MDASFWLKENYMTPAIYGKYRAFLSIIKNRSGSVSRRFQVKVRTPGKSIMTVREFFAKKR